MLDGTSISRTDAAEPPRDIIPMARLSLLNSMSAPRGGSPQPAGKDAKASAAPRPVRCYHCHHDFSISIHARSAACPSCYRGLCLDDLIVKTAVPQVGTPGKLQTCGQIVVEKKAKYVGKAVQAVEGIEIQGQVEAEVVSGGSVLIGAGATHKGDLTAATLIVEPGAVIKGGFFRIGAGA